ncbi:hypothetical protein HPC49_25980 [Pyxidicoccus fallax]|uniref:Uncharacterized protein n=1 Tax=Pyxidicoccus fallax TaxID=394095 RepID=A0A848LL80_9BACT|nr:hypothetical protein [Pyxidicoccus fallax]NMO18555.1 hypothetical protein [Pyxidicoccus fallax]NPC81656.1 hypothetical protein [Pyxidicoccus fallax]
MKLLVLPPHRDVTLVPDAPEGWHVMDVARDFCHRVLSDAALTEATDARATAPATAQSMRELLLLRAARGLSSREDLGVHTRLRAIGAVLTALSGPPSGVRLRLDDLELEDGTTERSADVLRAVGQPAPYTEDLARAAERFTEAERVRLWLERDQQLPAAAWLARACPPEVPLEVAGPFATAHRKILARMPMFQRAEFIDDAAPLRWRVAPIPGGPALEPLVWIPDAQHLLVGPPRSLDEGELLPGDEPQPLDVRQLTTKHALGTRTPEAVRTFTGGAPWGGHVALPSLAYADALLESGCRVAVVGLCAVGGGFVLDSDGSRMNQASLARGARRLRDAGVRLVAEWWVGAPRVGEESLDATLAALDAEPLFDHIAGVRPFHLPKEHRTVDSPLGWRSTRLSGSQPADRDLARSLSFDEPGTIPASRLPEVLTSLASRLMRRAPLNPGRVAAASVQGPTYRPPPTEPTEEPAAPAMSHRIHLDEDCALVQLPASLDGAPKPTWYAANLRTGAVLAMDARLAPKLSGLTRPASVADVLGTVPEAQRARLVDTLVAKSVLTKVHE